MTNFYCEYVCKIPTKIRLESFLFAAFLHARSDAISVSFGPASRIRNHRCDALPLPFCSDRIRGMPDLVDDDPDFENERACVEAGSMQRGQPAAFTAPVSDPDALPVESRFLVDWCDGHRESTYPADAGYPNGTAIDVALDATRACRLELPYPAARCGLWVITCRQCAFSIALSTSGRADDPRSARLPCRPR